MGRWRWYVCGARPEDAFVDLFPFMKGKPLCSCLTGDFMTDSLFSRASAIAKQRKDEVSSKKRKVSQPLSKKPKPIMVQRMFLCTTCIHSVTMYGLGWPV